MALVLTLPGGLFAQTRVIDSLKNKIANAPPSRKLQLLLSLGEYHQSINKDSLYHYALTARKLAKQVKDADKRALADIMLINAYLRDSRTDSAALLTDSVLKYYPFENVASRSIYFKLEELKVDCFGDASDYKNALSQLYKIIREAEQAGDAATLAMNMSTIGVINYNLDHVPVAFSWYFKGSAYITDEPRFDSPAAVLYINLAETYRWVGKTDSAFFYVNKAIPRCNRVSNLFYLANALRVKASILKDQKKFDEAEQVMMQCIAIRQKVEGKLPLSNEKLALASIYMRAQQPDKAIDLLNEAIARSDSAAKAISIKNKKPATEASALKISAYRTLAKCYQDKGDTKNYAATLEKLIHENDAFYAANSADAIAELQAKYDLQKKESTIAKQQLAIAEKNYLLYGSMIVLLLLGVVAWLLFINYKRKQNVKMQLALNEEKRLAALSIVEAEERERRRIAADLHDNIGAYATAISTDVEKIIDGNQHHNDRTLNNLHQNSKEIINSLRDTIWVLNKEHITITEISDRIKNYISKFSSTYDKIEFHIQENIENDISIGSRHALNIFRIMQEALHNAVKHSSAKNITIAIVSNENIHIEVKDDGAGMPADAFNKYGNGLLNMRERAEEVNMKLELSSGDGDGTSWTLYTAK